MQPIFISYRRSDADGQALNLSRNLKEEFGPTAVLLDVDGLEKGRDFRKTIDDRLATCKVLLALIGRSWLDAKDEHGARRLNNQGDFVRYEISKALQRDIPVIPVLVGGASMPEEDDLPADMKDLVFRDGIELTHARWDSDVQVLIKCLEPYVPSSVPPPATSPREVRPEVQRPLGDATRGMSMVHKGLIALVGAAAVAGAGGWYVHGVRVEEQARASELAKQREEASRLAAELAARDQAAQQAALDKLAADRAAADKTAADKALMDKLAADRAAADKAAADKAAKTLAAARAATDQAAAQKLALDQAAALAQRQAAEAAPKRAAGVDFIASVAVVGYGPAGAKFDVRYETQDRSPTTTTGIRVCIVQSGRLVAGTPCMIHSGPPGPGRATIEMVFKDSTATALKGRNQASVSSCLGTYPRGSPKEFLTMSATCRTLAW